MDFSLILCGEKNFYRTAIFGDNLSFISDTTIVATRSQGVRLSDKFRANIRIALPAAVVCFVITA